MVNNIEIYPNFNRLKTLAKWGGMIGILQSLIWIGLSIVGILYYYGVIDYTQNGNYGTIEEIVFYNMYFHGTKEIENLPNIDSSILANTAPTLNPEQMHIWIWVYFATSIFWLLSSISLITHIKKFHLRRVNTLLYIWVFIVLYTSGMDLALAIIFALDYDKFNEKSYEFSLPDNVNKHLIHGIILTAAKISSISMMIMAARGFILWIINIGFMSYFFKETLVINELGNDMVPFIDKDYSNQHSVMTRSPIKAFDTKNNIVVKSSNNDKVNQPRPSVKLNSAAIERANRMSKEVLEDRKSSRQNTGSGFSNYREYPDLNPGERRITKQNSGNRLSNYEMHTEDRKNLEHRRSSRQNTDSKFSNYGDNPNFNAGEKVMTKQENNSNRFSNYDCQPEVEKGPVYPDPDYTPPMPRVNTSMSQSRLEQPEMKNKRYF